MASENPIEEIWRIREKLGAEEGYDVHRLFERLRREQQKYADRLVQVVPGRASEQSAAVLREEPRKTDQAKPEWRGFNRLRPPRSESRSCR